MDGLPASLQPSSPPHPEALERRGRGATGERSTQRVKSLRKEATILATLNNRLRQHCLELQQEVEELTRQSFLDPLTGMVERLLFLDRLRAAMRLSDRTCRRIGLVYVSLEVYDLGPDISVTEGCIRETAHRVVCNIRASDTACRIRSRDFIVMLPEVDDASVPEFVARKLTALLQAAALSGKSCSFAFHTATAIYPTHGSTEAALLSYLASQVHAGQERMDPGEAH